jgi:hypothetical protein
MASHVAAFFNIAHVTKQLAALSGVLVNRRADIEKL